MLAFYENNDIKKIIISNNAVEAIVSWKLGNLLLTINWCQNLDEFVGICESDFFLSMIIDWPEDNFRSLIWHFEKTINLHHILSNENVSKIIETKNTQNFQTFISLFEKPENFVDSCNCLFVFDLIKTSTYIFSEDQLKHVVDIWEKFWSEDSLISNQFSWSKIQGLSQVVSKYKQKLWSEFLIFMKSWN